MVEKGAKFLLYIVKKSAYYIDRSAYYQIK